jgi:hypothetical protein
MPAWEDWVRQYAGKVPLSDEVKAFRNAAVESVVCHMVNFVMGAAVLESLNSPTSGEKPRCVVVAMDEVGHCHQLVRALCAARGKLVQALSRALGGVAVRLVAIGTGIDSNSAAPGSEPGTYFVERIPANGALWTQIVSSLDQMRNRRVANFLALLSGNSDAMAFAQNSRVASVMFEGAMQLPDGLLESATMSTRCGKSVIPAFLLEVARRYKRLNGARESPPHEISRLHAECARALLFLQRSDRLGEFANGCARGLSALETAVESVVYGFGMLTDQAQWIVAPTAPAGMVTLRTSDTRLLVAPMNQTTKSAERYMLSSSQLALFRFTYGFDMPQPADGDGFEAACVQFLEFVLLGASGCTMGELLEVLGLHVVAPQHGLVLTHTAVRVLQATTMIHPRGELRDCLGLRAEEMPAANEVLVIRNAPRASFADMIVIFPRVGVLLIQNKFYSPATPFGEVDAARELKKMGMALVDECGLRKSEMKASWAEVAEMCDNIPLATASKCFAKFVRGETVRRKELEKYLRKRMVGDDLSVPIETSPLGGLHDCLRSVASCGEDPAKIWMRFCLMTTTARIGTLRSEVLQFHAMRDTLFPIELPTRSKVNYVEVSRFDTAKRSETQQR